MSEVLKWMPLGEMAQRSRIGGGSYVQLADFDAEHALRLKTESRLHEVAVACATAEQARAAAERQVRELREQLKTAQRTMLEPIGKIFDEKYNSVVFYRATGDQTKRYHPAGTEFVALDTANGVLSSMQAKLDTAIGLLRKVRMRPTGCIAEVPVSWWHRRDTFLNTTSTEGKDHD